MRKIYLHSLTMLLLVGCAQNEIDEKPSTDQVELKFKSTALAIDAATKAPFEGTAGTASSPLEALVWVKKQSDTYFVPTPYNGSFKIVFQDGNPTGFSTTPCYFPADGTGLDICALYPYSEKGQSVGMWDYPQSQSTAKFLFDGTQDVMTAAQVSATKAQVQAGTYPTLNFKHLLTKLIVKVKASDAAAVSAWGKLTKLELIGAASHSPQNNVTVNMVTGENYNVDPLAPTFGFLPGFTVTGNSPFPFYVITGGTTYGNTQFAGQAVTLATTSSLVAYSLVSPINATGSSANFSAADYVIKVYTENVPDGIVVPFGLLTNTLSAYNGSTQGKAFEVTLTFKATEVTAKANVSPWVVDGTSSPEIK